ncbi:MAG: MBL fold metallo-hydrolase [Bacteroidales bacterium]|nr:MBL fold metallo-hydrolase [Bacteroidales bacterium]
MKLFPVHISDFKLDGGAMFGVVPKILWQKKYPCDENNYCNWALRSLLFDNGKQRIMVDNGYGDKQDEKFFSFVHLHGGYGLEGALEKYGYKPEDITDMVISHLHYDHCGGGVKNSSTGTGFEMVFPNATYWVSKQQWEWALNPNKREAASYLEENILPMQESGQLKFIEDNIELYPGFKVRLYNGHTTGQIIPFISYQDKTVVYMADLIPSSAHVNLAWNMSYDVQPLITLKEKEQFLEEAYENDYILFLEHDAYNECCTIEKTKKGYRVKETFTLEEYFGKS